MVAAVVRVNSYGAWKRGEYCDVHVNEPGTRRVGAIQITLDDGTVLLRCRQHVFTPELEWPEELRDKAANLVEYEGQ